MKGRYAGRRMTIYGTIMPGAISIANWANKVQPLTDKAKWRLKIIDWHRAHGNCIALTARHFGFSRFTIRSWIKKFNQIGAIGLNEKSHRPKHLRQPTASWKIVSETVMLRQKYPAWSKYKIRKLLKDEGLIISASTVGRIFKRKGLIDKKESLKRKKAALSPRARFPRGFKVSSPGDMIQMDTKHEHLVGGRDIFQFTAIDVLTKKRTLKYYSSLTSKNGADFLEYCIGKFPFRIKNLQSDNGSEFLKEFDKLCKKKKIPHYFIYPRKAKQNSYVEISHEADEKEFYQQGNMGTSIEIMQERMKEHEHTWNEIRPHQALDYLTPNEYFFKWQRGQLSSKNPIILQA